MLRKLLDILINMQKYLCTIARYDIFIDRKGKARDARPTLKSVLNYPLWAAVTIAVVAAIFVP